MYRKIYFNDKALILSNNSELEKEEVLKEAAILNMNQLNEGKIKEALYTIQQPKTKYVVILHNNLEELYNAVNKEFTLVKAAGGLVYTSDNAVLLIFRRGKWDLPKGKLDEGEDLETCAVRELEEETGIANVQLQQPLIITYHTYYEKGKHILKESYWYLMFKAEPQPFVPQLEEDIEKCEWVKLDDMAPYLQNSLPSIIDVINAGKEVILKTQP